MARVSSAPVDFRILFEKSPGLYLVLDPALRIVAASDGYCRATRIQRESVLGKGIFEVFTDDTSRPDADGVANLRASLERVLRLHRPDPLARQRYDVLRPAREGGTFQERYWNVLNVPVLDDDGSLLWIVHCVNDITRSVLGPDTEGSRLRLELDQHVAIEHMRQANEELAHLDSLRAGLLRMARLNTISMMASALAHDVSQPLTAAKNYLSALRRGRATRGAGDPRDEELLDKMAQQIDRAGEIVKDLRSFMAVGSTVHRLENVADVVADSVRLAEAAVRSADAVLTIHADPALPKVAMDRVQMQQLLVNLVTNAAEATRGRPQRAIDISATATGDALRLDVADTGPGLPDMIVKRLYEPFATTKFIGMGLGLPICRQIVKEHNGAIAVAPNMPAGAIVTVTIPLRTAHA